MRRDITRWSLSILFFTILAACSDGSNGGLDPVEPVAQVVVSPASHTLRVGASDRLAAVPRSARGRPLPGRAVTWRTDDATVVEVAANGVVRALRAGVAVVTATSEGRAGTARLTVLDTIAQPAPSPTPVLAAISPAQVEADPGELTLTVTGSGFTPASRVEWDGQPLPTVDATPTQIRARVGAALVAEPRAAQVRVVTPPPGGGASTAAAFTIDRRRVVSVALSTMHGAPWTFVGDRIFLTAVGRDARGEPVAHGPLAFLWSSADAEVAAVTASGGVRGRRSGTARVTATADGASAGLAVTVLDVPTHDLVFASEVSGRSRLYLQHFGLGNVTPERIELSIEAWEPSPSPQGTRIAFQGRGADGNRDIYVVNRDGSGLVRLTTHPAVDDQPAWSPDGSRIAFRSARSGWYDIWVMDADGSNQTRLTSYGEGEVRVPEDVHADPAWSPDGSRIAFARTAGIGWFVGILNADGSGVRWLETHEDDAEPAWRADGEALFVRRRLGATARTQIAEIAASDGHRLDRHNAPHDGESPAASPDGRFVAFRGAFTNGGAREIVVAPTHDAGAFRTAVSALYGGGRQPAWIRRP